MTDLTHLALRTEELAVLVDALEADLEDYSEAAEEAKGEGAADLAAEFGAAAQRVQALLQKVRGASND